MITVIEWLNTNEGTVNAILSVISLLIACVAVAISVSTAKRQNKIELFEKRFEIYSRFVELIYMTELITEDSLTYKGKMLFWNVTFFGVDTESSRIGREIFKIDEQLESKELNEEEREKINSVKKEKAGKKFDLDYQMFLKDKMLLNKSELLFPESFCEGIRSYVEIYGDVVVAANYAEENDMSKLFEQWKIICDKLRKEKYMNKMKKYINLKK